MNKEQLKSVLAGRVPLHDTIQLLDEQNHPQNFQIEEVMNAGGSCICYKAKRMTGEDRYVRGTLKEFYPLDCAKKDDAQSEETNRQAHAFDQHCAFDLGRETDIGSTVCAQLRTKPSRAFYFYLARDAFYQTYKTTVNTVRNKRTELENFIAPYFIYKGIAPQEDPQNFTYYIWTEGENTLVSFEDYLTMMRDLVRKSIDECDKTNRTLAYHFYTVLKTVTSLARGIKAFHDEQLLHLDIKPSNFGIRLSFGRALPESISLFDLNAVYSIGDSLCRYAGTDGFRAPEMDPAHFKPTNACDLYSLGATLYYSVVFPETAGDTDEAIELERQDRLYRDSLFDEIDSRVAESALFRWSEINSQARMHDLLTQLLKGSLVRGENTSKHEPFVSVSEFIECAEKLLKNLEAEIGKEATTDENMTVVSQVVAREDYWDDAVDTGATGAMQCLLYDYPLYEYEKNGIVDVLVLGCGTYAQRFIDIAFEMSQVRNCNLNITVITHQKEDETRFLALRPDFTRFFTLNGVPASEEPYGNIRFLTIDEKGFSDRGENADKIKAVLGDQFDPFAYVFIALGATGLNRRLAIELAESNGILSAKKINRNKPLVNYVVYEKRKTSGHKKYESLPACLHPVQVENVLVSHADYAFLKRMAFNTHLIWKGEGNVDLKKERARFRAAYKFNSSLSNVLSLKYKLHSMGIELDKNKLARITHTLIEKLSEPCENGTWTEELALYEHRRWVVNAVCNGWVGMKAEEYGQLKNETKDVRTRRHPCIVPSKAGRSLKESVWYSTQQWDRPDLEETDAFNNLDDLDKMSVRLHRALKKNALSVDLARINEVAGDLQTVLTGNAQALALFSSYYTALCDVLQNPQENIATNARIYAHYRMRLLSILQADAQYGKQAKKKLDELDKLFTPICLANEYADFKNKDYELIGNMPFILNYSTSLRICIPFEMTRENRFENVASCLMLNPSYVTYLIDLEDVEKDGKLAVELMKYIACIMDSHNLQTRICAVLTADENRRAQAERIAQDLCDCSERIVSGIVIEASDSRQTMQNLREYLNAVNGSATPFSLIERNKTRISGWLDVLCSSVPTYAFDSASGKFEPDERCAWLDYLPFHVHLNVEDLFATQGCLCVSHEPEMLNFYKKFWEDYYRKGTTPEEHLIYTAAWKKLCAELKKEALRIDQLGFLNYEQNQRYPKNEFSFYAPAFCKATLVKLFTILKNEPYCLLDKRSFIEDCTSVMLKINLVCSNQTAKVITAILSEPHKLMDASQFTAITKGNIIFFYCQSLCMKKVEMPFMPFVNEPKEKRDKALPENVIMRDFLYKLKDDGFLLNFTHVHADNTCSKDYISFTFCSQSIKDLLTNEGNLLELYVYYELLRSGYYDDVRTGVEVHRCAGAHSVPTHELDLIAVKGMNTQLCEIKARTELSPLFYSKLYACARNFGINTKAVIIADLLGKTDGVNFANGVCMQRGKEDFGVHTVHEVDEIAAVAKFMRKHIENT